MHMPLFLLSTAWHSIAQHKGRSLLTVLSIIVGIASVIATMAIGRGAQERIRRRIASMGTNTLSLYAGGMSSGGSTTITKKKRTQWIRSYDADYLRAINPDITHITRTCFTNNKLVSAGMQRILAPIISSEATFAHTSNRRLAVGRLFLPQEQAHRSRVAILGHLAAKQLFKAIDPLGKTVRIDGHPFTVIGVLAEIENFQSFSNKNLEIYVPLSTGKRLFHPAMPDTAVHGLHIAVHTASAMPRVERVIQRAMRARHKLAPHDPSDFTLWNQAGMAAAAEQSSQTFNLFLLIVASLSLLVGGIGVSNVMLMSVTERTKEIGIRLALGAPPHLIMAQFLCEAIMLCSLGGMLGILIGTSAPYLLTLCTDWHVIVTPWSITLSVAITLIIGLVFGFVPAQRAARMNVVEALHD